MNVNEMGKCILQTYKALEEWPQRTMPEHLMELVNWITFANDAYKSMRQFGVGLIFDTCAINRSDCEYADKCDVPEEERDTACSPHGLAFRLADILMYTMAVMIELGIDIDTVVMAEYKYLAHKAEGVKGE